MKVAPFKAQNMSNNSMVCADPSGRTAEIGRAQWVQAMAARATPEPAMNPVLLKPGSDRRSHVVLMGRPWGHVDSSDWLEGRRALAGAAHAAYDDLAARYDVVVAEGAGSPTEINLRAGITSISGWPGTPGCRRSSSVTSIEAACSPRSSARSRCCARRIRR